MVDRACTEHRTRGRLSPDICLACNLGERMPVL
jgi:hypothetical protein